MNKIGFNIFFSVSVFIFAFLVEKCLADKLENSWKARGTWQASDCGQGLSPSVFCLEKSPETRDQTTDFSLYLSLSIDWNCLPFIYGLNSTQLNATQSDSTQGVGSQAIFLISNFCCSLPSFLSFLFLDVVFSFADICLCYVMSKPKSYCLQFMCRVLPDKN